MSSKSTKIVTCPVNVMVIGAAGGIGKSTSMILADSGSVSKLILVDIVDNKGLAEELNHITSNCFVKSQAIDQCDVDCDIVVVVCGKPQSKIDQKRDDLFRDNAKIYKKIMETLAPRMDRNPIYIIVGNPVNSLLVVCAETLKKIGKYDKTKLLGFNELDLMRSKRFLANEINEDPKKVIVPLIGGHSEKTIFPVFECARLINNDGSISPIIGNKEKVKESGDNILHAYDYKGTAVYSTAIGILRMVEKISGPETKNFADCCFIEHGLQGLYLPQYFTIPCELWRGGVKCVNDPDHILSKIDKNDLEALKKEIQSNIDTAMDFIRSNEN
ncbi:MAG: hypothetical protein MHPSP_002509 [Paramarteilia canceri]